MMKTIRYIFIVMLSLSLAAGCMKEEDLQDPTVVTAAEGKVIIDGDLSLPFQDDIGWATKAFGEVPQVKRLYLAVFNDGDILYEIVKAKPGTQSHPTNPDAGFVCGDQASGYLTKFHVELTSVAQGKRYVHFIATSEPIASLESGTINMSDEGTFVRDLVTTGAVVAYWGREEYTEILETTEMKGIKMIRNFAKAKVTVNIENNTHNFAVLGFKVFNAPVYGTIAPFNNNTPDYINVDGYDQINFERFAHYKDAIGQTNPYTYLTETDGYLGYMPPQVEYDDLSAHYTSTSDTMDADGVWVSPDGADYLYECSYRPDRNPFIILKATFDGSTYYYKADFVFKNTTLDANEYYNILRNFLYTLNITGVNGKGSNTVYDAVNSIAINNFEASTESQELTNIALDDSRLYVSKTDILITSGTTFTMYVKSRTGTDFGTNDNAAITGEIRAATSGSNIVSSDTSISIAGSDETSGQFNGWRKVTVTVEDAANLRPGEVWKQPIVFKNAKLSRTVNLTLRRPSTLTVDMQDVVAGVKNTECELKFSIPAGLTEFRFPMYFYIEQEENNLYPKALADGDPASLTVMTGPTNIPDNTGNAYFYRRTLTWEEYTNSAHEADINGIKTFSCWFKTLKDNSATRVWVVPAPENNYYDPYDYVENEWTNCDSFLNNKLQGKISFPYYGIQVAVGGSETVTPITNSGGEVTFTSSNASVATVDANGKVRGVSAGTAVITATLGETGSYTGGATASYTVQVVSGDLCGMNLKWKYEPTYVLRVGSSIHAPIAQATFTNGYSGTVTYSYSASPSGLVTVNDTNAESLGYVTITGSAAGTVTVTATATAPDNGSFSGMTRSISYDIIVLPSGGHPESGTVYHNETFLGPTLGDYATYSGNTYSTYFEKVTDGATYQSGTDVTALFYQYTTYNVGTGYNQRHVWYPYYNFSTNEGFGAAASGYGSIEAPTEYEEGGHTLVDYHNSYKASHSQMASKVIDLSCSAGVTVTFYHCGNYFFNTETNEDINDASTIMRGDCKVKISANGGTSWEDATVRFYPSGSSWSFVKTSVDIPASYLTANFRIMFDYVSTNTRAGTWEIKNMVISEK